MTPPWNVDGWNLTADLAKIEQQWGPVRAILEDVLFYDLRDEAVSAWSCGQHAGHIVLVARSIARGIERNLDEPDRSRNQGWEAPAGPVLVGGRFPRGRAKAPAEADPVGRTPDHFLAMLGPTRAEWSRLADRADELPSCHARFSHFVFGYLTSVDWVRMCAIHTAHHLAIVRDIANQAAHPPPAALRLKG